VTRGLAGARESLAAAGADLQNLVLETAKGSSELCAQHSFNATAVNAGFQPPPNLAKAKAKGKGKGKGAPPPAVEPTPAAAALPPEQLLACAHLYGDGRAGGGGRAGAAARQLVFVEEELWRFAAKLDGATAGRQLSVAEQVSALIKEATNVDSLAKMWEGWMPWV